MDNSKQNSGILPSSGPLANSKQNSGILPSSGPLTNSKQNSGILPSSGPLANSKQNSGVLSSSGLVNSKQNSGILTNSAGVTRTNSIGTASGRTFAESARHEGKGFSRTGSSLRVEQDPDVESGRWSFMDYVPQKQSSVDFGSFIDFSNTAQKGAKIARSNFGSRRSTHSQSPLDMLAAGLDIASLPFYDLSVRNLHYKVNAQNKARGKHEKILINNVSAEAFHGQVLAVVGPSGSGKTTFLDALAGRIEKRSLKGEILVNGEHIDESFNWTSGYVMQDDALFPMLTVRETLLYSARLRIPGEMPLREKKNRVENMISTLGLKNCADTRVGNDRIRGVSGGERRRVSIGADLIHDPAVLFLDEPTSGLDSTSALNVMQKLSRMAKSGNRTVVLTIHQPSFRILDTIDRVLVLGQGNVIFHGLHQDLKDHFNVLGRSMPDYVNTIEYALDTIEEYQRKSDGLQPLINLELNKHFSQIDEESARETDHQQGDKFYTPAKHATSMWSECWVLADRNAQNIWRTPELFLSRTAMMLGVGLTLGTLFLQVKYDEKGVRQRASFFTFTLALLIFTSTESLAPFLDERQIFIRETSRGAYRAWTYVVSGAVVILPFLFFLALLYSAVAYFLVGLVADSGAFAFFTVVVFLTLCTANSFVIFFSGIVPNFTIGLSLCCACIAYFFLFAGFFIERKAIPSYWIWLHYISLFKYPYELMFQNELGHLPNVVWRPNAIWVANQKSHDVLQSLSLGSVHEWVNIVAMIGLFVGYRVLFWITLKFFTSSTRK